MSSLAVESGLLAGEAHNQSDHAILRKSNQSFRLLSDWHKRSGHQPLVARRLPISFRGRCDRKVQAQHESSLASLPQSAPLVAYANSRAEIRRAQLEIVVRTTIGR